MKEKVVVAAVQTDIALFDMAANLHRIEEAVKQAKKEKNADWWFFPSWQASDIFVKENKAFGCSYIKAADKIPGEFTASLMRYRKAKRRYIISGMTEAHPNIPATLYNSAVLVNPKGRLRAFTEKPIFQAMRNITSFLQHQRRIQN